MCPLQIISLHLTPIVNPSWKLKIAWLAATKIIKNSDKMVKYDRQKFIAHIIHTYYFFNLSCFFIEYMFSMIITIKLC